jgi:hypothetical protein
MPIPLPPAQVLSSQTPVQNYQLTKLSIRDTLRLAVYRQSVGLGVRLRLVTSDSLQPNHCRLNPHLTSYLSFTVAAGPLQRSHSRSESRGTDEHILLSQIRDSPNLEVQVPVFISPRNSESQLYPHHWVPFSSPPTTRRAAVEAFESASTRGTGFTMLC